MFFVKTLKNKREMLIIKQKATTEEVVIADELTIYNIVVMAKTGITNFDTLSLNFKFIITVSNTSNNSVMPGLDQFPIQIINRKMYPL